MNLFDFNVFDILKSITLELEYELLNTKSVIKILAPLWSCLFILYIQVIATNATHTQS